MRRFLPGQILSRSRFVTLPCSMTWPRAASCRPDNACDAAFLLSFRDAFGSALYRQRLQDQPRCVPPCERLPDRNTIQCIGRGSPTNRKKRMARDSFEPAEIPIASRLGKHVIDTLARCRHERSVLLFQGSKNLRYRLGGDDLDQFSVVKKYFAHAGLAVAPDGRPLGVLFSLPWTTDPDMTTYWVRRNQASLSQFGLDMAYRFVARCPKVRVHLICDVAAGLYDLCAQHKGAGVDVELLVRATRARTIRIESPSTGRPVQAVGHLAATTPVLRHCPLEVGRGRNTQGRDVRITHVSVHGGTVGLLAPLARGRCQPVYVTALLVTEDDPPPNRRRLKWLFLSSSLDLDVTSITDCLSRYEHRWTFDEFFRVLNAGTRRERRTLCDYYGDLRETDQFESWLASDSVHAWRVLGLLRLMHVSPHLPAKQVLGSTKLACLHFALQARRAPSDEQSSRPPAKDIRSAVIDIGRLAGFLPSKRQVLPGRELVWRGCDNLRTMTWVYEMAEAKL